MHRERHPRVPISTQIFVTRKRISLVPYERNNLLVDPYGTFVRVLPTYSGALHVRITVANANEYITNTLEILNVISTSTLISIRKA